MTTIERWLTLDTGAVSDALDKLGLVGVVTGIRPLTGSTKIAGRVVTVKLVEAIRLRAHRHLCTAAIEAAEPGDVIVVEHRSRDDCAGWGGLLSAAAKARGLAGTLVDGAVRDLDESRELGYPVFARSAVPKTARGRVVEDSWNVPVTIGEIDVHPGDLVIADSSGVVFVSASREREILETAETIARHERRMAEAVRAGTPVSQVLGDDYEWMTSSKP
ncbi:MAG TPA: RraA family protein [Vicinamibacteria bacterium]|nr:RraA family protein [Vicinamibacteria bacterium]